MRFGLALAFAVALVAPAAAQDAADIVLVNGRVYTLDDSMPWAEAVAIQNERLLAVGSNEEVRRHQRTPLTGRLSYAK